MGRIFYLTIMMGLMICGAVYAADFSSDITILPKKDIVKLTDEQLLDTYLDTLVELDASKTFHNTSGFTPKDYREYKDLVKFRLLLLMEIHSRNLETPQFDKYSIN